MGFKENFLELKKAEKTMNDLIKTMHDMVNSTISDKYDLDTEVIKEKLSSLTEDDINNADEESAKAIFYSLSSKTHISEFVELIQFNEDYTYLSALKEMWNTVKEYNEAESQKNKISQDIKVIGEDYIKYINSDEYKNKVNSAIDDMRKQAENETDDYRRNKLLKKLDAIEKSKSLAFIFDRIINIPTEVDNITYAFFDARKSSYVIEKSRSKFEQLGYKPDMFKLLLGIEDKFLPEKYKPFNNLYLFIVMRFIAYSDVNDSIESMYAHAILLNAVNLIQHNLMGSEEEAAIQNISKVLDNFESKLEQFTNCNITWSEHPDNPSNQILQSDPYGAPEVNLPQKSFDMVKDHLAEMSDEDITDRLNSNWGDM